MGNERFECVVLYAIDGDSVVVRRKDEGIKVRIRVAGVDVASHGESARSAIRHITSNWVGHTASFKETCCGLPHGEIPGVLIKKDGSNLGMELLRFGKRLERFPIQAHVLPSLSGISLSSL